MVYNYLTLYAVTRTVGKNQLVTVFTYYLAINEVKILGHRRKVGQHLLKRGE